MTGLEGNINVAKTTSMIVLGGAAFIFTLLPVFIDRKINKNRTEIRSSVRRDFVLSLMLAFGGGVLLCTTFLHLLPEVTESVENLQKDGKLPKISLSIPELIMCCGFFIMYTIEEVVHTFMHSRNVKKAKVGCDNPLTISVDNEMTLTDAYKEVIKEDTLKVTFSPSYEEDVKIIPTTKKTYSSFTSAEVNENYSYHNSPNDKPVSVNHHIAVTNQLFSLRELLIVLALTVHEAFEGCAIGLESTVGGVWYLMTAVAIHKSVIAFCIGVELVSGQISNKLTVVYALIFSFASPFGIGVGFAMSSSSSSSESVPSVILQGIATGTLLYVVFFEVLKRDHNDGVGLVRMIFVILGFVSMAAVMALIEA